MRRVIRSQAKQCKKSKVRNPEESDSNKTSESIVKIARATLETGKVLGVKVTANEANALKRITKTLKSNRSSRSARSNQND